MIRRIGAVYLVEAAKAIRLKSTYIGPVFAVILVAIVALSRDLGDEGTNPYAYVAYATTVTSNLLGLLMIITYCSSLVSNELGAGTAAMVLVRPVRRVEFYAAKVLLGLSYALGFMAVSGACVWIAGAILDDFTGVSEGGEVIYTNREMVRYYGVAFAATLVPLAATVAYAVCISTFTRSSGAAAGLAIAIWIVADLVKYPLGVAPFLFSTYLDEFWGRYSALTDGLDVDWTESLVPAFSTSTAAFLVFSVVGALVMRRKSIRL